MRGAYAAMAAAARLNPANRTYLAERDALQRILVGATPDAPADALGGAP